MLRLDAINAMLASIGEDPVTDPDSQHPSAQKARFALDQVDRKIQVTGWWFNKEYAVSLAANLQGEIVVPQNVLDIDPTDNADAFVQRGARLYDPVNHTYTISRTVLCDIVFRIPFEDLPEAFATYVTAYAVWQFYVDDDGDEAKARTYLEERQRQFVEVRRIDLKAKDLTIMNRPAVASLLNRIRPAHSYVNSANPLLPGGWNF